MAVGREAADELWQAASEGKFVLEAGAAKEVAGHYEWFASEMVLRQKEAQRLQRLGGFGGFVSAQHLQQGFESKAHQAFDAFKIAEESAHRMAAAIFKSAGLIDEVEASNKAAINAANKDIGNAIA